MKYYLSSLGLFHVLPCWMTIESKRSFISARSTILSSTVFSVIKRNTHTCFFWPILWARSWTKKIHSNSNPQEVWCCCGEKDFWISSGKGRKAICYTDVQTSKQQHRIDLWKKTKISAHSDHSLQIHLRIPVRVVDDDDVSCGQIDTETACSGAQHEQKLAAVGLVEGVDGDLRRLFITELFSHDRRPIHNYNWNHCRTCRSSWGVCPSRRQ